MADPTRSGRWLRALRGACWDIFLMTIPPALSPLLSVSRLKQATKEGTKWQKIKVPWNRITYFSAFWPPIYFLYWSQKGLETWQFILFLFLFFFKAKRPRPDKNKLIFPADHWDCHTLNWQITTVPTDLAFARHVQSHAPDYQGKELWISLNMLKGEKSALKNSNPVFQQKYYRKLWIW